MAPAYYKRFRMEIDLVSPIAEFPLPDGYRWLAWSDLVLDRHAQVKARSFHGEADTVIFPSLGSLDGCRRLMRDISRRSGFAREATWLIAFGNEDCGTIQGVIESGQTGAVQNVGVVPSHRGQGLATRLVTRALNGFFNDGVKHVRLEVTAENAPAVRVYDKIGFRQTKVLHKAVTRAPVS